MSKPHILILEDQKVRVDWLRQVLGEHAVLSWHTKVAGFLGEVQSRIDTGTIGEVAAFVFDHDLTPFDDIETFILNPIKLADDNGEDGSDAARKFPKGLGQPNFLIWSVNPNGVASIYNKLGDHGYTEIERISFFSQNYPALTNFFIKALRAWNS